MNAYAHINRKEGDHGYGTAVFHTKRLRFITRATAPVMFVHSAVERAGMTTLNEGQRLTYEIVMSAASRRLQICKMPDLISNRSATPGRHAGVFANPSPMIPSIGPPEGN